MDKRKDIRQINKVLEDYIKILRQNNIDVLDAYLFGSYAKGTATENSDIDVALVTNHFIGDEFDFSFLLMKLAREVDIDIEPHPYLAADFNNDNPYVAEILSSAKKII